MRATKPFPNLLGERLRQLREQRNISAEALRAHLGCHRTFVWKMENGATGIPVELLSKLARLYQVDENDLLTFPALSTRHELYDATRELPETALQQLLREARRLAKSTKTANPTADNEVVAKADKSPKPKRAADNEVVWNHVQVDQRQVSRADKQPRKKVV